MTQKASLFQLSITTLKLFESLLHKEHPFIIETLVLQYIVARSYVDLTKLSRGNPHRESPEIFSDVDSEQEQRAHSLSLSHTKHEHNDQSIVNSDANQQTSTQLFDELGLECVDKPTHISDTTSAGLDSYSELTNSEHCASTPDRTSDETGADSNTTKTELPDSKPVDDPVDSGVLARDSSPTVVNLSDDMCSKTQTVSDMLPPLTTDLTTPALSMATDVDPDLTTPALSMATDVDPDEELTVHAIVNRLEIINCTWPYMDFTLCYI